MKEKDFSSPFSGLSTKQIKIHCGPEEDDMVLCASYSDEVDIFDIWMEFSGDEAIAAFPIKGQPGRLTTHGGGDYCIDKRTAIALRDWLLYCFPLDDKHNKGG